MKRVYIAGPISRGDLGENVNKASRAYERLALAGLSPLCPHWSVFAGQCVTSPVTATVYSIAAAQPNALTHEDWLRVDLAWLSAADAVLRLPGESVGADEEVRFAHALGIPVFQSATEVIQWARGA